MTQGQPMEAGQPAPSNEPVHLPLSAMIRPEGLPDASDADLQPPRPSFKFVNRGTLLILGLAALGLVTIWGMRLGRGEVSGKLADSQIEARIEQALAKLTKPAGLADDDPLLRKNIQDLLSDTDSIVKMLANDPAKNQVPIEFVKKNPFQMGVESVANGNAHQGDSVKRLNAEFAKLKLQSVVNGRMPLAMINDQMCRVGDRVGSFTVTAIRQNELAVGLVAAGTTFNLSMDAKQTVKGVQPALLRDR
jgi:hypothetical protein